MFSIQELRYENLSEGFQRRFEAVALELGDFPALHLGDRIISYKDLNHQAEQIADALQVVTDAQFIITIFSDEVLAITSMLAVAKLGRVWINVNYRIPPMIIAQYISKLDDVAFFTNQSLPEELQNMPHPSIFYDALKLKGNPSYQSKPYAPKDYLQIVPTFDSKGILKGLAWISEAVSRNIYSYALIHEIEWKQAIAFIGDPSFAANVATVQASLVCGATLHIFNLNQTSLADFYAHFQEYRIASLQCVPSVFREVFANVKAGDFPDLRLIRIGGEAGFKSDFEMFKRNFARPTKIINGYGSTELGGISFFVANHDTIIEDERLPVGKIRPYYRARIINDAGESVIGEEGEMVFYDTLLQGYWNEADTDTKFFTDPDEPEGTGYRSGLKT